MRLSTALPLAAALVLLAPTGPAAAADCDWPGPDEARIDAFLNAFCYNDWARDVRIRDTGPFVARNPLTTADLDYGVHPAVRIYYSPNVAAWVEAGRPAGGPAEPAMIVKEMYPPPAQQYGELDDDAKASRFSAWTVMLRDTEAVADGWYWLYGANSHFAAQPSSAPAVEREMTPFEKRVTAQLAYPDAGFGSYCTRCHASAVSDQTFSTLANFGPEAEPVTYLVVPPAAGPATAPADSPAGQRWSKVMEVYVESQGTHAEVTEPPPATNLQLTQPLAAPDPAFLATFPQIAAVPTAEVEKTAMPPETFDHVVMPPDPDPEVEFLTSDQCIGCHDATVGAPWNPPMLFPDATHGKLANLSPYGEWRYSMMGLAGRDPIFFAQLESERSIHAPIVDYTQNLCLSCHGAMGQRQFHADRPDAVCTPGETDPEKCFTRDRLAVYSTDLEANSQPPAKYGALGREGISCAICHHISAEGLGTRESFTGNFKLGPSTELYGPYKDVLERPMQNGLGITPKHAPQISDSAMCGSCHTIFLPVYDGGKPVLGEDGKQLVHPEQTTYIEWLNSTYQDGTEPIDWSLAQSC